MGKSRLSWYKQQRLIELFVAGVTARTAASLIDVNVKTAISYFQRKRPLSTPYDPKTYLTAVLKRINNTPVNQVEQLLPWNIDLGQSVVSEAV